MKLTGFLFFLTTCFFSITIHGQETETVKDSTGLYKKIEVISKKGKFTKMLHKLIFEPTSKKTQNPVKLKENRNYQKFEGKIIRNITIDTKDPFGFSFTDSTEEANRWIEKVGNKVHIKSKEFAIRNFLLLEENTPLDTLLLDESVRLIRSQNYIREVKIIAKQVAKGSDSVDISITALDSWSLIPQGVFSTTENRLKLKERNLLGFGHQFNISVTNRLSDGKNGYSGEYRVPNFKHTFISATARYIIDLNEHYTKSLNIERPFYSPLTRWAGGIYLDEQFRQELLPNALNEFKAQNFKYLSQDVWAGHSYSIFKGNSERDRTTKLISSARILHIDYKERPSFEYDSIRFFSNETFYMATLGISSRQFVQDAYIFRDGITEDIPIGTIYAITAGHQRKNQKERMYLGGKIAFGNYYTWGYLSASLEAGTYFNHSKTEQTTYAFQTNYFTNLLSLGHKWKMRQFIKPQFILGFNRLNSIGDRLTINQDNRFNGLYGNDYQKSNSARIPGFNSNLLGTKKYVLSLQTQFYSPWEVLGFRLNPFLNITGAMISTESMSFGDSKVYSSFGIGFIIRNDYLVFSAFQISFSYYPEIPGQGFNQFNTNSFETEDFGFQNFELGKPRPVWYN